MTKPLRLPLLAALAALVALAPPAHALRVATYNVLDYRGSNANARNGSFRTILAGLNPDVLIVQELNDPAGRDSLLNNVLNVVHPGQWTGTTWQSLGSGEGGAIFWRPAKASVTDLSLVSTGGPRLVLGGVLKPAGYVSNAAWTRLYSVHFKAGTPLTTTSDSTTRRIEGTNLRTYINNVDTSVWGPGFLIGGDTNFYGAWEGGYIRLTESQADNDGRGRDPIPLPGAWNDAAFAIYHTQSTRAASGGMDDRFDLWLSSSSLRDGQGLEFLTGSNVAYGNDGAHFNADIDGGGVNAAVGITIATALRLAADHLPVLMQLSLPARVVAASQLAFGDVITGAPAATQNLAVSNGATSPADKLRYTLVAPVGFTVSPGADSVAVGAAAKNHTVSMLTGTVGVKTGSLFMSTNDVDSLSKFVQLHGRVLAHAAASLDSATVLTTATADFGDHPSAGFGDLEVRVHNQGWDPLQAGLAVTGASITGGDGRFSIVGFNPVTLGEVGRTWTLQFDGAGASADTTYEAVLTFTTSDEALPGATAAATLTVNLVAHVSATTDVPGSYSLRLSPPRPNPARSGAEIAFELPREAPVEVAVYDLGGRRVATVADGRLGEGPHVVRWNAQDASGRRVAAGLYFVRFSTPGLTRVQRLALLP